MEIQEIGGAVPGLSKAKSSEGGKRRDALFVCPCPTCSPKPIDPLAPRKSNSNDTSSCCFVEPPDGTLPPPPSIELAIKEATAGETVKVSGAFIIDIIYSRIMSGAQKLQAAQQFL
jgi:hypothetical protein